MSHNSYQFDLFVPLQETEGQETPAWRTLPAETRQTLTALLVRLILDHADRKSAGDRKGVARDDV